MKSDKINAIGFCDYSKVNLGEWLTLGGMLVASVGMLFSLFGREWYVDHNRGEAAKVLQESHGILKERRKK